jgi:hypothetical protein
MSSLLLPVLGSTTADTHASPSCAAAAAAAAMHDKDSNHPRLLLPAAGAISASIRTTTEAATAPPLTCFLHNSSCVQLIVAAADCFQSDNLAVCTAIKCWRTSKRFAAARVYPPFVQSATLLLLTLTAQSLSSVRSSTAEGCACQLANLFEMPIQQKMTCYVTDTRQKGKYMCMNGCKQ